MCPILVDEQEMLGVCHIAISAENKLLKMEMEIYVACVNICQLSNFNKELRDIKGSYTVFYYSRCVAVSNQAKHTFQSSFIKNLVGVNMARTKVSLLSSCRTQHLWPLQTNIVWTMNGNVYINWPSFGQRQTEAKNCKK